MTEFGIEEKNILPLLGLDGLPVHIRRTLEYIGWKVEGFEQLNTRNINVHIAW